MTPMIDEDLTAALSSLRVHYQPIVDLNSGAVAGFEALARIDDDQGNARSIAPIIEAVENDPALLEVLMRQLLATIRREAVPLFERYADFYISVNVPPAILGTRTMRPILEELDLFPYLDRVVCEVTERQALTAQGRAALDAARKYRIRLALDDFGTGQSGIAQLLGLTVDVLKLDQSQVNQITRNHVAEQVVRGIIALAALIRARIVAEGVETAAQALFLQAAGVDYGQGWFWSEALPVERLPAVIETGFPNWRKDLVARLNGGE